MNKMNRPAGHPSTLRPWGKRGGEKLLSIWWFMVLAMVAGGIALGAYMFYSADLDIRELEADFMANRVYDCINDNGYLRSDVLLRGFDLYEECSIRQDIFSEDGAGYSMTIEIYDGENKIFENSSRSEDLRTNCQIGEAFNSDDFPRCVLRSENFLFMENGVQKELKVNILAVSHQHGRTLSLI